MGWRSNNRRINKIGYYLEGVDGEWFPIQLGIELFSYYGICAIWLRFVTRNKLIYYKHAKTKHNI